MCVVHRGIVRHMHMNVYMNVMYIHVWYIYVTEYIYTYMYKFNKIKRLIWYLEHSQDSTKADFNPLLGTSDSPANYASRNMKMFEFDLLGLKWEELDSASFKRIDEVVHVHLRISRRIVCGENMFVCHVFWWIGLEKYTKKL